MIFCSMNCSMQFSASLEVRQRQAQLKERSSPVAVAETKPPTPQIKLEASPTRVSANMDEIIAAVAADTTSFSPSHPNSPSNISGSPGTPSTTPTSPLPSTSPAAIKAGKRHRRSSSQISEPTYPKVPLTLFKYIDKIHDCIDQFYIMLWVFIYGHVMGSRRGHLHHQNRSQPSYFLFFLHIGTVSRKAYIFLFEMLQL